MSSREDHYILRSIYSMSPCCSSLEQKYIARHLQAKKSLKSRVEDKKEETQGNM